MNTNKNMQVKKNRIPFDFDFDIREYFDSEKIQQAAEALKELNDDNEYIRDTFCFKFFGWGNNLSTYEENLAKELCNSSRWFKKQRLSFLKGLTDNHFTAAYTLNYYFYHNYMNDKKVMRKFAEELSQQAGLEFCIEEETEDYCEELDYDCMEESIITGAPDAVISLAVSLTDEELEEIVGTDLFPYAKYILEKDQKLFKEVTCSYYLDRQGILDEMIDYFFEKNRALMNALIEEHL